MKSLKSEKKISSEPQYFRLKTRFLRNTSGLSVGNYEYDLPIDCDSAVLCHIRLWDYSYDNSNSSSTVCVYTDLRTEYFSDLNVIGHRTGDASTEILIPMNKKHIRIGVSGVSLNYLSFEVLGYMPIDYKEE